MTTRRRVTRSDKKADSPSADSSSTGSPSGWEDADGEAFDASSWPPLCHSLVLPTKFVQPSAAMKEIEDIAGRTIDEILIEANRPSSSRETDRIRLLNCLRLLTLDVLFFLTCVQDAGSPTKQNVIEDLWAYMGDWARDKWTQDMPESSVPKAPGLPIDRKAEGIQRLLQKPEVLPSDDEIAQVQRIEIRKYLDQSRDPEHEIWKSDEALKPVIADDPLLVFCLFLEGDEEPEAFNFANDSNVSAVPINAAALPQHWSGLTADKGTPTQDEVAGEADEKPTAQNTFASKAAPDADLASE